MCCVHCCVSIVPAKCTMNMQALLPNPQLHINCTVPAAVVDPLGVLLLLSLLLRVLHPPAGSKLLYLGGASGTSVSHCSDLVGPEGAVYAVEFSHRRWVRVHVTKCLNRQG